MSYQNKRIKNKRSSSKGTRHCRRCGTNKAIIRAYGLDLCRRCFREVAEYIGFRKYS
ncbi:MAG: 30S ribosomal protein S14 [Candidatus Lokiarchaeota archaeon]|nr:30S ribosomal protein S14 [Candidatus Lokiarchaeota archaeon]